MRGPLASRTYEVVVNAEGVCAALPLDEAHFRLMLGKLICTGFMLCPQPPAVLSARQGPLHRIALKGNASGRKQRWENFSVTCDIGRDG